MKFSKKKCLLLAILVGSICARFALSEEDVPGSSSYWLLNPREYAERNQEYKERLEACVSKLGFVRDARILRKNRENVIEIDVINVSSIPITGLVVQPMDERLTSLGLDGRTRIDFNILQPNERVTFSETFDGFASVFPSRMSVEIVAWDVVNIEGVEIVEYILWSRWPLVSADEEFLLAKREFCGL